jgi:hypothetical protein
MKPPLVRSPRKLEGTDAHRPEINPPCEVGRAGVGLPGKIAVSFQNLLDIKQLHRLFFRGGQLSAN